MVKMYCEEAVDGELRYVADFMETELINCSHCLKPFRTQDSLDEHILKTHRKLECPECKSPFTSQILYDRHRHEEHGIRYKCNSCDYQNIHEKRIIEHQKWFHLQDKHEADNKATGERSIKNTDSELENNSSYSECVPDFTRMDHTDWLRCSHCFKMYENQDSLDVHIQRSHMECPECKMAFSNRTQYDIHRSEAHGFKYSCGACDYKSVHEHRLIRHQRNFHLQERNAACPKCDMTFFNTANLKRHLISHGTQKYFTCAYCPKKFPRNSTLKMHEKIHTGTKNQVCKICDERFVQRASLTYHMKKHHPDAKF